MDTTSKAKHAPKSAERPSAGSTTKPTRATPDWELIEFDYRAGIKSLRQIADEHGITHGAVNKRAKAKGWSRDLSAKIKAKAEEKVSKAAVSTQVSTKRAATEQAVIEAGSELLYQKLMEHRDDIRRGRQIFGTLLSEVEHQSAGLDLFERLGEMLDETRTTEDGRVIQDKLNELYRKIISTPGRVDSAKKLVEMLEKLVKMERQAFNMDADRAPEDALTKLLHSISSGNTSNFRPVAIDPDHEE